jgi:hypothetical protein
MAQPSRYLVKGSAVRAYVKELEELKKLDAVLARVSPEAAALVHDLPMPSSWVDAHRLGELVEALCVLDGRHAALELGRAAIDKQLSPLLMPMLTGILRVIGVSPATVFMRYESIVQTTVRGTEYRYQATSPRSGYMDVRYDTERTLPWAVLAQNVAGFESIFKACGANGTVGDFEIVGPHAARFPLSW